MLERPLLAESSRSLNVRKRLKATVEIFIIIKQYGDEQLDLQ
jgi:hypothetical protein